MVFGKACVASAVVLVLALALWPQGPRSTSHSATLDANWQALMKNMDTMQVAMNAAKPTGNKDADFVILMLPHHQAAVDMARTELLYGSDPQMRRLAQEIIVDQDSEIQLMRLWVDRHEVQTKSPSDLSGSGPQVEK